MNKFMSYTFCESYIDNLVNYIDENYIKKGKDLSRLAIIFGGKRPSLFVKRQLAQRIESGFYSPKFFTIDEFVRYTVRKQTICANGLDLDNCYLLYQLAKKETPDILKGRASFAEFLPWTKEIVRFIDQLDLENFDNKTLEAIKSNAEIGYDVPEDINILLKEIVTLRVSYHKALEERQTFSRGMQYFHAAQIVDSVDFDEFDEILFCNFFYFNRSEEKLAKSLHERGKATFLFQGDQRRWPILKRIATRFSSEIFESEHVQTPKFDLKLYKGFNAHSQVCMVREILKGIKDLDKTVVVLPNADQIIPLISEITTLVRDFNISMGYPLKRSSLYTLLTFIFQAQLSRKDKKYYARDYLKVLQHPFVKNLNLYTDSIEARTLVYKIEEILTGKEASLISGSLFVRLDDIKNLDLLYELALERLSQLNIQTNKQQLQDILDQMHKSVFQKWENVLNFRNFAETLESFLDVFTEKSPLKNYPLNLNIVRKIYSIKDEFKSASFSGEKFEQSDIFRIFDSKISGEIVAFVGSPLKGLQVLGLFETRSLNFENVIVLDTNEGVLPKLNLYEPLIPREVMISLNLDRLELEEEIQRYQFMRLISSAKNVHLVYQESKEKERSRFIEELIWEEEKKVKKAGIVKPYEANFASRISEQKTVIAKTPEMIQMLSNHKFSASSVNMYLRSPIDFYYSYVLGLKEQEDLLDEPDARHIGTFVHGLLEEAFRPFVNKKPVIDKEFRTFFAQLFERKFAQTFSHSMKSDAFLLRSVVIEKLNRFLDFETNNSGRDVEKILYLEERFEDTIKLSCGEIKFGYIIDRIDQMSDGTILILDYKTGSVDYMPKSIEQIKHMELSRESIFDNVQSFQIPLYFNYLLKHFPDKQINAALYNLRMLNLNTFIQDRNTVSYEDINKVFIKALDFVISEILNPDVAFVEN